MTRAGDLSLTHSCSAVPEGPADYSADPSGAANLDPDRREALTLAVADLMPAVLADLDALARIPSISSAAFDAAPVAASAAAVARLLTQEGLITQVVSAGGHPAVIGRLDGPQGAPRVLLYAHHDVQPASDDGWDTPPFEPTRRGDRLYGRGIADDKAGVLAHVAAIRAHRRLDTGLPVSVIVFVEGEEETGSATLPALLAEHREALDCDVIVLADSMNWSVGTPALTTMLRGLVQAVVTVRALHHGVHSGMFGGPVPDAVTAMCRLLSRLHHPDGTVAVPGLIASDDATFDYPEAALRLDGAVPDEVSLLGTGSLVSRLWTKPAVTVTGIDVPDVAHAVNVLQPACRAMVSLRIAPAQDPQSAFDALAEHLRADPPWGVAVDVEMADLAPGFEVVRSGPYVEAARTSFTDAWGVPPVDIGVGGSIPFVAEFAERFPGAAILVTGVEDPDTRAHGSNERLHVGEFQRACLAEALLLERFGGLAP
ncbi:MAG TPA: M20/M25/M40 family metallo-hydrolase [Dermatophilaceae bacterium]|nr:M20/M25/M40 family metallo-hydrolase [Dermatophilaceae bacterium]